MKLFIISNRLPIKIIKNESGEFHFIKSEGGLATGLASLDMPNIEKHWIGWPGMEIKDDMLQEKIKKELNTINYHPVFLSEKQIQLYYEGYCNSTLWPLFHYFYSFMEYDNRHWDMYQEINKLFCKESCKLIQSGDIVWVQDYHLMLLPKMLRDKISNIKIGYFHHVPFPSYELFRVLPERAEILHGLLGADLIGFHTFDYVRHFASAVYRVLKFPFQLDNVCLERHKSYVNAFPMGINYELYHNTASKTEIQNHVVELKKNYGKNKLILSVDRLDYSKGIVHRIKGFGLFLKNHPEYRGEVSLVMIIVPSRDTVGRYAKLKKIIDEKIGAINGKYSTINWTPVHYFYHSFEFNDLVAMYSMADIALITSLRDGMNLVAKEYVAAKQDTGVLILSEMAGSAAELRDAIIINPNDIKQIENAIMKALNMPVVEQKRRIKRMQGILSHQTVKKWANDFISQLEDSYDKNKKLHEKEINNTNYKPIYDAYQSASRRLLIFDYDGTLTEFKDNPEDAYPSDDIIDFLKQLSMDKKNNIVISSGRDRETLEKWFGKLSINMAAEHGVAYKENGIWHNFIEDVKWDNEIVDIMQKFVERTPGALLEKKKTALVWHFRSVDEWLANLREQQLVNALIPACNRLGLQIMRGNKILEIKTPLYSKGSEVKRLLKLNSYNFIFTIGDDVTDEEMFKALPDNAYSIKVGYNSGIAKYNIPLQTDVMPFLRKICINNSRADKL